MCVHTNVCECINTCVIHTYLLSSEQNSHLLTSWAFLGSSCYSLPWDGKNSSQETLASSRTPYSHDALFCGFFEIQRSLDNCAGPFSSATINTPSQMWQMLIKSWLWLTILEAQEVCICVYMCVCTYLQMYPCVPLSMSMCMHIQMYVCV